MADTLRTKLKTTTFGKEAPPSQDEKLATKLKSSQEYLDEYKALSDDPQYAASVPDDTRQSLKDAIARAEQAYNDKASKNEWLEVAQMLGRAGAQFAAATSGAASSGKADLSNLNFGAGIDYGARTDRAFREYQQGLRNATDEESMNRQLRMDTDSQRKDEFGRKKDYLKEAINTAQSREGDEERYRRTVELEQSRATREKKNDDDRAKRESAREEAAMLKLQEKDLQNQLKEAKSEEQNAKTAASMISTLDDLSPKSVQKLESQLPGTLGKAGITPQDLAAIEQEATEKGFLWNSIDKNKRNDLIQQRIIEKKQEHIGNLRQALDTLLQRRQKAEADLGSKETPQDNVADTTKAPPPSGPVQLRHKKTGKVGAIPAEKVKEALDSGEFEKV